MAGCGRKWGILMFMGEYHHTIDEKGRLVIPTKFRLKLGEEFVVARGMEKCLYIYSKEEWNRLVSKLNTLPFTKKDARAFIRSFFSGATECEFDRQGRTCITSVLMKYANLTKDCVIIGANERIEIWNEQSWTEFLTNSEENLSELAESLFTEVNL